MRSNVARREATTPPPPSMSEGRSGMRDASSEMAERAALTELAALAEPSWPTAGRAPPSTASAAKKITVKRMFLSRGNVERVC